MMPGPGNTCNEFFKVYLSQQSSNHLGLPPAFVRKLGGKIPKNCTIKDSDGKIWQVKLEGGEASLVVANGWEEFASHHSLVDGDFLVFNYDGNSQFGVKIYGMNGLRKRKAPDAVASTSAVKKRRQQGVEEMSNSLPLRPRPQGLRPNIVYKRRNSEVPRERTSIYPGRHDHSAVKFNQCRGHVTPCTVEEAASNFTSAYPYFKAVVSRRTLDKKLYVPSKFVRDHIKPRMQHTETKLLVANGKWSVTLNIYFKCGSYGQMSAGWFRFAHDNCLEVGDQCFFELIKKNPVIMKVSIFKHNGSKHASGKPNPSRADAVPKAEKPTCNIVAPTYPSFTALMYPGHFDQSIPNKFVMYHIKPKIEYVEQVKKVFETNLVVMDNEWIVGLNVYFKNGGCGKLSAGWRNSVPRNFVEDHISPKMEHPNQLIKKLPETLLVVANGKWSVTLNIYFKHRYGKLSAGWVRFARDNGLEVGDECLFELINNEPVTMKVSIFKHISE